MSFSFAEFFKDTPWLGVPPERQGVFIAPLYPRGGLLGGSSDGAPKVSKLQALAAARKKKAQEQKSNGTLGVEKPMSGLSLSNGRSDEPENNKPAPTSKQPPRGFPLRKRKNSDPHEKPLKPSPQAENVSGTDDNVPMSAPPLELDQAEPSAFANTMFNSRGRSPPSRPVNLFTLPYAASPTPITTNPFAGPSPDDVVIAAQSKGSTKFRLS